MAAAAHDAVGTDNRMPTRDLESRAAMGWDQQPSRAGSIDFEHDSDASITGPPSNSGRQPIRREVCALLDSLPPRVGPDSLLAYLLLVGLDLGNCLLKTGYDLLSFGGSALLARSGRGLHCIDLLIKPDALPAAKMSTTAKANQGSRGRLADEDG